MTTNTMNNYEALSQREMQVLSLMATGLTVKEIASQLYISHHTIISHKKNMMIKLNSKNTIDMIVQAVRAQVI